MTQWHMKSKRKASGGISTTHRRRDKVKSQKGGIPSETTVGEKKSKILRTRGGNSKVKLYSGKEGILSEKGKNMKVEIVSVVENKANRQYTRRNVITKGAIVKIKQGNVEKKAKVTSRPGQTGEIQLIPFE